MKKLKLGELGWLLGILLCSLGVHFSARSGFGVSMVVAPAYVLSRFLSGISSFFSFGNTEYCFQGLLLLLLIAVLCRFKWKYLGCFVTSVLYGLALDGWNALLGSSVYETMTMRIVGMVLGAIITALAISFYLHAYLPQQVYELVVKEVTERFSLKLTVVKWVYDISSLALGILLMLLLFGRFDLGMIGIGTLLLTVINTPLIAMWGKLLDKFCDFSPAFPRFHEWFEKYLD